MNIQDISFFGHDFSDLAREEALKWCNKYDLVPATKAEIHALPEKPIDYGREATCIVLLVFKDKNGQILEVELGYFYANGVEHGRPKNRQWSMFIGLFLLRLDNVGSYTTPDEVLYFVLTKAETEGA